LFRNYTTHINEAVSFNSARPCIGVFTVTEELYDSVEKRSGVVKWRAKMFVKYPKIKTVPLTDAGIENCWERVPSADPRPDQAIILSWVAVRGFSACRPLWSIILWTRKISRDEYP
jgi:hypothetical protein